MTVGSPPAPQHARSRILAIDDAPEVLDQIRYALGGEFDILATRDGVRGADIAKRLQPELVLLDVMMPDIDGFEVCRRLKADPATCDIPVIFFTGLGSEGDELRGFELGAVDFVTKPIEPVILLTRVRTQVALSAARSALKQALDELAQERTMLADTIVEMRREERFCADGVSYVSRSLDKTGGDLVLSVCLDNGDRQLLVGDFTGHGLPAAVGTPLVSHLFYDLAAEGRDFPQVLLTINKVLRERLPIHIFMAASAVRIRHGSDTAEVWNFGNPSVLHRSQDGEWLQLESSEPPMGILQQDTPYTVNEVALGAGDALYLMTDGPIEAECRDGSMFGLERLIATIDRHGGAVAAAIEEVYDAAASPADLDDITLLKFLPRGGATS